VTRAFESEFWSDYAARREAMSDKVEIVRLKTKELGYLPKEELWREVPIYVQALIDWIEVQPARPHVIHAHYADAGVVVDNVRERLRIPYGSCRPSSNIWPLSHPPFWPRSENGRPEHAVAEIGSCGVCAVGTMRKNDERPPEQPVATAASL
jgi:hypothetical protein